MKQNSSVNNDNNNKLLVLIVESGKNIPCSCWGQTLKSLCQVYSLIYQVLDVMTDSGMERASTLSSLCVFCPVWIIYEQVMIAALDCSRDDLALVSFRRTSSHTQKLHSLTTITTLQHLRCQM